MEQDLCKNCIRTRGMRKAVCPECHGENVQAWLEGPCMFLCCPDCGLEVIRGSFYAPCEQDTGKAFLGCIFCTRKRRVSPEGERCGVQSFQSFWT